MSAPAASVGPSSPSVPPDSSVSPSPDEPRLREYLTSRRGRSYLRMTLRNRTLVDTLIDRALGTGEGAETIPEETTE